MCGIREKRLIDANALAKDVYALRLYVTGMRNGKTLLNECMEKYRNEVLRTICKAPTVDAVEVVHGRNKTTLHPVDEFICSVCGYVCQDTHKYVYDEDGEYWSCYEFEFNYYPDCGAKMDGGNEDV